MSLYRCPIFACTPPPHFLQRQKFLPPLPPPLPPQSTLPPLPQPLNRKPTKEQQQFQADERDRDEKLNQQLKASANVEQRVHKLLLLGSGESGKSTLFKQIQTIYGDGLTTDDLRSSRGSVYQNIVQALHDLAENTVNLETQLDILDENRDALDFYKHVNTDGVEFTQSHYDAAMQLWSDPSIQAVWDRREQFHIPESAKFFLDKLDIIAREDYCPSHDDFLRIRVRTTGIVQKQFEIDKNKFLLFDVGGQRNERKKVCLNNRLHPLAPYHNIHPRVNWVDLPHTTSWTTNHGHFVTAYKRLCFPLTFPHTLPSFHHPFPPQPYATHPSPHPITTTTTTPPPRPQFNLKKTKNIVDSLFWWCHRRHLCLCHFRIWSTPLWGW